MIPGNNEVEVYGYIFIDRLGEGLGMTRPGKGEAFLAQPWGYHGKSSIPFIEVWRNGELIRTVNALDCSQIEFQRETPNAK